MVTTVTTITNRDTTNRNAITPSPASTPTGSEPPIGSEPSPPGVAIQLEEHVDGVIKVGSGVGEDTVTDAVCK